MSAERQEFLSRRIAVLTEQINDPTNAHVKSQKETQLITSQQELDQLVKGLSDIPTELVNAATEPVIDQELLDAISAPTPKLVASGGMPDQPPMRETCPIEPSSDQLQTLMS
jgi:hypothetical protein